MSIPSARWSAAARSLPVRRSVLLAGSAVAFGGLFAAPAVQAATTAPPATITVKFHDDVPVTATGTQLQLDSAAAQSRLGKIVGPDQTSAIKPLFSTAPTKLDADRRKLEDAGKRVADLTSFVRITLEPGQDPAKVIAGLEADPLVDSAEQVGRVVTPATPNLTSNQTEYWGLVGITQAQGTTGILGGNTSVRDVEWGFNDAHEEFVKTPRTVNRGSENLNSITGNSIANFQHGTAVAGIIGAKRDGVGIDGIAPSSNYVFKVQGDGFGPTISTTVVSAANDLSAGDVILLEVSYLDDPTGKLVPAEYYDADYAAIQYATAKGITVIEAAGNGNVNLDTPPFSTKLNRPDSGAVMVGAGNPSQATCVTDQAARSRLSFSNYGARVNIQAPGACVAATGYGSLFGTDDAVLDKDDYTKSFNGTSSASAVTAGIAAALSSAYESANPGVSLDSATLRRSLVRSASATPQAAGPFSGNIGPQINLKGAVDYFAALPETQITSGPGQYSTSAQPTVSFTSTAHGVAVAGYDCRYVPLGGTAPAFAPCSAATSHTPATPLADGDYRFEVRARTAAGDYDTTPATRLVSILASPTNVTASVDAGVVVTASPGDANAIVVRRSGSVVTIEDSVPLLAGQNCGQVTSRKVTCSSVFFTSVKVDAGDLDDSIDVDVPNPTTLIGGAGNDTLRGVGSAADSFDGGVGTDMVSYAGVTTAITGTLNGIADDGPVGGTTDAIGSSIEGITGGTGADVLTGGTVLSTLRGGPGNDTLKAGPGGSTLDGGLGNDAISAGNGVDRLENAGRTDDLDIDLENQRVTSGSGLGVDTLAGRFEIVYGGDGNDEFTDTTGPDWLVGGGGNDDFQMLGGGDDRADGGIGEDTFVDGIGNDNYNGDAGDDTITLWAATGSDVVNGGADSDTIDYSFVSAATSVTRDGVLNDGAVGVTAQLDNIGVDVENVTTGSGADTIDTVVKGRIKAGAGFDTVSFAGRTQSVAVIPFGGDLWATLGTSQYYYLLGVDQIIGTSQADTMQAGTGAASDPAVTFDGGPGDDTLTGGSKADKLIGGTGVDTLDGGAGDDRLETKDGTAGDRLTCGAGTDSALLDSTDVRVDPAQCETATF